ncbi:MAG: Unknown protein [uncultured Thiotrichaceae bacterium]|uniref:DUF4202 domain-containing protein n=1 Tax=uncultured Thiotrichaceae bacterium TaxID=298394 RepID=A0A6S6SRM1_9GAMM|nr:MAG: Unknown protein [uncultured Thiotrichaceae bacterium]
MTDAQQLLDKVITLFDAANSEDPNIETDAESNDVPKELLYSLRMRDMINRFKSDAEDLEILMVAAQHIQRWKSPRSDYPMNRKGYHLWRTNLYKFHADTAGKLMVEAGYDEDAIERVKLAIAKKKVKTNPDTQLVEDIAALTFIEHYMMAFYQKFDTQYDEDKWIDIILRTWKKMSPKAQAFALAGNIALPEALVPLIQKALAKAA